MLFRKLLRDLWVNRIQFISIFLMSFLGIWIFVGINAESTGGFLAAAKYYDRCNLADLWLNGEGFSEEEAKQIEKLQGVNQVERRLSLDGDIELNGVKHSMETIFTEKNEISQIDLLEGEEFEENKDGFWMEEYFAKANHLAIGDTATIRLKGTDMTGIIRGYIRHPEHAYYLTAEETVMPNYANYGYVICSIRQYPFEQLIYNQILVDTQTQTDAEMRNLKNRIKKQIDRESVVVTDRDQNESYATFDAEMKQHEAMGMMFSIVFLLIAVLGIVTTMTRMTANQRIQIGTLKALGFSKRVITFHYVSYGFFISLVGSIMGAVVGYYTMPDIIFGAFKGAYIIPDLAPAVSAESITAIILAVVVSTFVSFMACRKELNDPPAITLKPAVPKKMVHTALEKSSVWLKMSFSTQWNLRDILRNKVRTLMGVVGVCGCMMLMIGALGCYDSIFGMMNWMYDDLMTARTKILMAPEADYYTTQDYANKFRGQMIQESAIEFMTDDKRKTGTLTVLDTGNYMHYQGVNLESIRLSDRGISMTQKMADSLSVKCGDYVQWHIVGEDEWERTRVTALYRDPSVQGITMYRQTFEHLEHTFRPTAVLTNKTAPDSLVDKDEIQTVMSIQDMRQAFAASMEMMNIMIAMMIAGAVILGVVVLYNLGVLSFVEKTREIATLKVLGFKSSKIRGILLKQNFWITTLGVLVGVPIGNLLLVGICQTLPDTMDLIPIVSFGSYVWSIIGTFAVSIGVNLILSAKVNTINMVDALKGVE